MRHPSLILLAACGLAASVVQAQTPTTITFEGEVTDQTCKININGQDATTVILPTVKQADLAIAGTTAGKTDFSLDVTGCKPVTDPGTQKISVKFHGTSLTQSGGNLKNTATNGATDVAVQLLDGTTAIDLSSGIFTKELGELSGTTTSLSKTFAAQYISESDTVGTGKVTAVVEYSLAYL